MNPDNIVQREDTSGGARPKQPLFVALTSKVKGVPWWQWCETKVTVRRAGLRSSAKRQAPRVLRDLTTFQVRKMAVFRNGM